MPVGLTGMIWSVPLCRAVAMGLQPADWAPKTVQNWVRAGLIPALVVGSGRGGGSYLLRTKDVDAFEPPPRGRPPGKKKRK